MTQYALAIAIFATAIILSNGYFKQISSQRKISRKYNIFGDIFGDGTKLRNQKKPERPHLPKLICEGPSAYILQEKLFSFSGEDFVVRDIAGNVVIMIDGDNINLAGLVIDKLNFKDSKGSKFMSVERRLLAATTCYDIYDNGGKCVAKIDRELFSLTPSYKFYYENDMNPFPDYRAEGSFSDRQYTFKAGNGDTIARSFRAEEAFKDVDKYQLEIAAGVDVAALLAMAVIIDEDHDEKGAK